MISNADVRNKALAKVKDKNFSVLSATAYAIAAVPLLAADITGILAVDMIIMFIVSFAAGLVSCSGYTKVAMGRWRQAQGGFRELFGCYASAGELKRGALPAGVYAVMLMLFRYGVTGRSWYAAVIAGVACIMLHIIASWGGYVIAIEKDNCPVKSFMNGVNLAARNAGSIIAMKAYLYWWIAVVIAITVVLCNTNPLPGVFTGLIIFLVGLVCRWMVGALIALSEAGQAREAYREK